MKLFIFIMSFFLFFGCTEDTNDSTTTTPTTETEVTSFTANDGRLLGSQCAQCHGTNGVSVNDLDSIAGEDELDEEFYEHGGIMGAQADGYTSDEVSDIQTWLQNLNSSENGEEDDD